MPRNRKDKADHWLPPRVYRGRSAYALHPKTGGAIRLCALDASEADVWLAYRQVLGVALKKNGSWLAGLYFESEQFKSDLQPRTQTDYRAHWKALERVFGKMLITAIKPHHVREYMDRRGKQSRTMANKEKKTLHLILKFGHERGHVKDNACEPVKNFILPPRTRYITDEEYADFYQSAEPMLQVFMEISYVCAARGQDVRMIKLSDLTEKGLYIKQQKTGKAQVKLYSPRLQAAIDRAKALRQQRVKGVESIYLILSESGKVYSDSGLKSLWRRAVAAYKLRTDKRVTFTFHDLKAKGISDFEGNKQNFSGHKSAAMMEKYNRTADETTVIDFKKKEM